MRFHVSLQRIQIRINCPTNPEPGEPKDNAWGLGWVFFEFEGDIAAYGFRQGA